ncbi:MAG: gephyrin-like molybdotransferase Glp [Gammaproteobacteria bacterium]
MTSPKTRASADCQPEQLSVDQALTRILASIRPVTATETLPIQQALGRILATAVQAPIPVPGHDNSAMDGYALATGDQSLASTQGLLLAGRSMAGHPYTQSLQPGECVRIMTGAVVPPGADSVVMQEDVTTHEERIIFPEDFQPGDNIRRAGEDLQPGQTVLEKGRVLRAADLGLVASLGITEVELRRKIRVAFFSTGDELVAAGTPLQTGQIYDSNRQTLAALLQQPPIEAVDLGLVADETDALRRTFIAARDQADVIITSGGVSVGEADFVKAVFSELGKIDFWRIAIKPGRPLAFGEIPRRETNETTWFFGLPGNPVSSHVTFELFAAPALARLAGASPTTPLKLAARLTHAIKRRPGRQEYQRGRFTQSANGELQVSSTGNQSSGVLSSLSQANCYIVLAAQSSGHQAGEQVTIEPFHTHI